MTKVLIVDDERNMRATLSDILEDEGFEVSTAESGEKAIKLCRQRAFDVILMDVRMPGIDGVEAFLEIRRHRTDARVIMMSAYSVDHLKRRALEEGAVAFLRKPLDVERVASLIADAARRPGDGGTPAGRSTGPV